MKFVWLIFWLALAAVNLQGTLKAYEAHQWFWCGWDLACAFACSYYAMKQIENTTS